MRIPVVDTRGVALMPCTPAKARHLFKGSNARPKRNKLGLFYVQLTYSQQPENQQLVAGVDPGSKFEGLSVVGTKDTVLNLMVEAPNHVKDAVETRRTMRRARRSRKWRRPKRFENRLHDYRTNKRLTQGAKVKDCRVLTWVAFRAWLVAAKGVKAFGLGDYPSQATPKKGTPIHPRLKRTGSPGLTR